MAWARIDDLYFAHPKVIATGMAARGLWVTALSWSASQATDGHIPRRVIALLGASKRLASELVAVGLWLETEDGYVIHDFLEYNPSAEESKAKRDLRATAGRLGGLKSGEVRRSKQGSKCFADASSKREANANPVPSRPVPVPKRSTLSSRERPPAAALVALWNATCGPLPKARGLSPARTRHAEARLRERPLPEWEPIVARIAASSFCRGETERGWVATFDWLVSSPDVPLKVLEGKYDNRGGAQSGPDRAREICDQLQRTVGSYPAPSRKALAHDAG